MQTALVILIVSGGALAALLLLFSLENKQQRRFALPVRRLFDSAAASLAVASDAAARRLSSGTLWYYTQKFFQHFIALCLGILRSLEVVFDRMQRRQLSNFHPKTFGEPDAHLEAMRTHKRTTALTAEERARLLEERLEE